jgi:pilus assembly protein Flp/PilA
MNLKSLLARLLRDDRGATAVEYGLILALVALTAVGAFQSLANANTAQWKYVKEKVESVRP